jgi:hypothetical protein
MWTEKIFKPKYDFGVITGAYSMFQTSTIEEINVLLDFTGIPSTVQTGNVFFRSPNLRKIKEIRLAETNQIQNSWFRDCFELEDVTFSGTIGQNGIDLQWCTKLSKPSITSLINALSSTAKDKSATLSKVSVDTAFETDKSFTVVDMGEIAPDLNLEEGQEFTKTVYFDRELVLGGTYTLYFQTSDSPDYINELEFVFDGNNDLGTQDWGFSIYSDRVVISHTYDTIPSAITTSKIEGNGMSEWLGLIGTKPNWTISLV